MHAALHPTAASIAPAGAGRRILLAPFRAFGRALLAESDRWPLWLPVAIAAGVLVYFALPAPLPMPALLAVGLAGLIAGRAAIALWRARPLRALPLAGLAALALGVLAAATRLALVEAPVLPRAGVWTLDGRIVELEPRSPGVRLVLDRLRIERLDPPATPERVRLTVRHGWENLEVGERVRLRAVLQPPRGPVVPGGFDHARHAWFAGIGAVGWALGRPEPAAGPGEQGPELVLARLRARLAERFSEPLPGPAGAVAAALVTGVRAGLDAAIWRDFQLSGLAHLLSISGLHMSLVAGTVLLAGRWLFALVPAVAERWPARKPAALLALLAAAFYLVLSGASVPAQRAFLMVAVALVAILVDRDPFSMRLLAWAAVVVVLLRPEAVEGASFQLSFAAVSALIAVWEVAGRRLVTREGGILVRVLRYPAGVAATTLVASLATAPLTAFHFQTVAISGVVSNLLAVPLTTFWIMPAGLLAVLLVPFGLEEPAVRAMGTGVELLLATARWAAHLPGAAISVPLWPAAALAVLWAGGLWLALWRRPWRFLGLLALLPAAFLIARERPPDLVATPWLAQIAARAPEGARVLAFERDELVEDALLRALGGPAPEGVAVGLRCDRAGCLLEQGGVQVTLARRPEALLEACREAGLVIARLGPERCPGGGPAELLGPRALAATGGLALWLEPDGTIRRRAVAETRGRWPWVRVGTPNAAERRDFGGR